MRKKMSLAEADPTLAEEWHPTKNGDLTPDMVAPKSHKSVWWFLPYDDPDTGKHFVFEWENRVSNRSLGQGCPVLTGHMVWPGFNDLTTKNPTLAAEWHPTKNGSLTPEQVTCWSHEEVWWILPYDDPETGKHFDFEWSARVSHRSRGQGCPVLTGHMVWPGFNDLATKNPDLAAQWHPTKNGDLTPKQITCGSREEVWWCLPYDDPETGKHYDFEWQATVKHRSKGNGCPFLSGEKVWPGFNDLATKNPDLAAQWHPTKNGELTPEQVTCMSNEKVWWYLPYDDPATGKHFDFEWDAQVNSRSKGNGCPILSGAMVWIGFNDLATKAPELAAQWHPTKNGDLTPKQLTCGSNDRVWWYLPYDDPVTGKHFDFEWKTSVNDRCKGSGCPFLLGARVWPGFNDLASCYPEIAAEWHPIKNRRRTSDQIYKETTKKVWWICRQCGHEWYSSVKERTVDGAGCSVCRKTKTYDT